ncbi:MAG: alpha/beta hydrolase [Mycobacterium sp.]
MKSAAFPFFSNGLRLDADLHLPDTAPPAGGYPVVVPASGFQGLKIIHPERFARALTARGYAVLAFDYRGFGWSEGERGRLVPQEWVEDVRSAVDAVSAHDDLDADRIALLGWGLGGGVVVAEAAADDRVRAVAMLNGIASGSRSTRKMHDDQSWQRLLDRLPGDRARRTTLGRSEITSPWDIVRLDLDTKTDGYVGEELYRAAGFGSGVTLESAEYLLRFEPVDVAHQLAGRPLLIVHGEDNQLHKLEEAQDMFDHAAEPKQIEVLAGAGHTEWMLDDNPTFKQVIERVDAFFTSALRAVPAAG